jgi:hypothetical protein
VLAAAPSTASACAPVTTYTLTATPIGGGAPIVLTGPSPTFSLASLPPGYLYEIVLAAWNAYGESLPSDPIVYSTIVLAESGVAAGDELLVALGFVVAGSALLLEARRRRAHR